MAGETPEPMQQDSKKEVAVDESGKQAAEPQKADEAENVEQETDAPEDKRKKVDGSLVRLSSSDSTLNAMITKGGNVALSLTEGGFQYLLAAVRGTAAIKAGRYAFEVTVVESLNPQESVSHGRGPQPKQVMLFGLSLGGSSLFLGEGPDNVCFDTEGNFIHDGKRNRVASRFGRQQIMTVVVNLDQKSPNANTISLFKNGVRFCPPQPLPESMKGKPLYPTLTYRNTTAEVHFGPNPRTKMPFQCRMMADAASVDVDAKPPPKSAKSEFVLPVGLPEQGYFDFVDQFLKKNPGYTEISDRSIFEWATKSGLWSHRSRGNYGSNDKPELGFNVPSLDDFSVRKVLQALAPTQPRNYIMPELTSNLLSEERNNLLLRFSQSDFNRKAVIFMGEPVKEYREYIQACMLAEKQAEKDAEFAKKKESSSKSKPADADAKDEAAADKEGEATADVDMKTEGEEEQKEPEKASLTEEELKLLYRKSSTVDVTDQELSKNFANFTIPAKDEGFDNISFAWQNGGTCTKLLKDWVLAKKLTQKAEDLQPGEWFKGVWKSWSENLAKLKKTQIDFQEASKKKDKKADADEGEKTEINAEDIDPQTVENVCDLGNGEPLFANFVYEDWVLLSTRFELHLLIHAFKKDIDDADRPSFIEANLAFYYKRYFDRTFSLNTFAVESFVDFLDLVKENIAVDSTTNFLQAIFPEDAPFENFVKFTEEHRRDRQQRIDAGDETAKLKFQRPAPPPPVRDVRDGGHDKGSRRGGGHPPARHDGNRGGGGGPRQGSYQGGGSGRPGAGGGGAPQKRPYQDNNRTGGQPYNKQPRSSYNSGGYSHGGGGGGNYYRR